MSKVLCHFGAARSTSVAHRDECGFTALCPCTSRTSDETQTRTRDSWTVLLPASGGGLVRMATDVNLRLAPRYRRTATFLLTGLGNLRACAKCCGGCSSRRPRRWSDRSFRHLPLRLVLWLFVVLVQSVCLGDLWSLCGGCAPCCVLSFLAWLDFGFLPIGISGFSARRSGALYAELTSTVLHVQQTLALHLVSTAGPLLTPYAVTLAGRPLPSAHLP